MVFGIHGEVVECPGAPEIQPQPHQPDARNRNETHPNNNPPSADNATVALQGWGLCPRPWCHSRSQKLDICMIWQPHTQRIFQLFGWWGLGPPQQQEKPIGADTCHKNTIQLKVHRTISDANKNASLVHVHAVCLPKWWFQFFFKFSPWKLGKISNFDLRIFFIHGLVQPPTHWPIGFDCDPPRRQKVLSLLQSWLSSSSRAIVVWVACKKSPPPPADFSILPSTKLTCPIFREKENHLQRCLGEGYFSSLEGNPVCNDLKVLYVCCNMLQL